MNQENSIDCETTDIVFLKETLMDHINTHIKENKLTQNNAAAILGTDQGKVSAIKNLRHNVFSLARLFKYLNHLGYEVIIEIRNK